MPVHSRFTKYLEDQREFFDLLITEDWDLYHSADWTATRKYEVCELFKRIQPQYILDIGCGCGFHDKEMAQYSFVDRVDAIDYSNESIKTANREYPHQKVFRSTADLRDLSESSYDLAVSWQVFEHLSDPNSYFAAVTRAVKKGGHVAIFTPNRLRLSNIFRILRRQPIQFCDPQHYYEYTPKELNAIAKKFDLKSVGWFGYRISGKLFERLSIEKKLRLGKYFPHFADVFCSVFVKK